MFRELSERNRASFRMLLAIFTGFLVLLSVPKWITLGQYLLIYEILLFLVAIAVVWYVIKKSLVAYAYVVVDHEFYIYEKVGSKESPLCVVDMEAIVALRPLKEKSALESQYNVKAERRYHGDIQDGHKAYVLVYPAGEQYDALIFAPSEQLVEILTQKSV